MALGHSPSIVTSGLVLYYDFGNFEKAFGTTNLGLNNALAIYNNVPSHVSSTLTQTSNTYRGSPIWVQTLTPTTATGVSYLTAGNNPGIGVYHNNGGGTGGTYTGHSIFFRPTVPMHSSPIFTHYSNIAGYQTTNKYDDMRDGWFRGNVVWYNASTLSDAKYWAINPASATLNVPITIYWAGPFREDQNYTNFVSGYTTDTRGAGSGALNLVGNTTLNGTLTNNPTYNTTNGGTFSFNGTNQYITIQNSTTLDTQTPTVEVWVQTNALSQYGFWFEKGEVNTQYSLFQEAGNIIWRQNIGGVTNLITTTSTYMNTSSWYQVVGTYTSGTRRLYINGTLVNSDAQAGTISTNAGGMSIGAYGGYAGANGRGYYYSGSLAICRVYNRALTAAEVAQNFNAHRGRYGI